HDANQPHSAGRGGGRHFVSGALRPDRSSRAGAWRRDDGRSMITHVGAPTAALAGIPAGLQSQGVWAGRRQLFVRFAAEAETATMYTADALANELRRATTRSTFHSIAIAGRDPLANVDYLKNAFEKVSTSLPVMLDVDGQRPAEIAELRAFVK